MGALERLHATIRRRLTTVKCSSSRKRENKRNEFEWVRCNSVGSLDDMHDIDETIKEAEELTTITLNHKTTGLDNLKLILISILEERMVTKLNGETYYVCSQCAGGKRQRILQKFLKMCVQYHYEDIADHIDVDEVVAMSHEEREQFYNKLRADAKANFT